MNILLSPVRMDVDVFKVIKKGNSLSVNGEVYDFSQMNDGDTLPREAIAGDNFLGDVNMDNGVITLTLRLPLPWNYSQAQAFPEPLLNVPDGPVKLPDPLPPEPEMKAPVIDQEEAENE